MEFAFTDPPRHRKERFPRALQLSAGMARIHPVNTGAGPVRTMEEWQGGLRTEARLAERAINDPVSGSMPLEKVWLDAPGTKNGCP